MSSVTHICVRYKDTDTMSVTGLGHEGRCDVELVGTS